MKDAKEEKRKMLEKWTKAGMITDNTVLGTQFGTQFGTQSAIYGDHWSTSFNSGPPLLPIAMRVAAKTIGQDIVPVMSNSDNTNIINEVKSINRDRKIEALVNGVEYKEMKPSDHPDFKHGMSMPKAVLHFIDFTYGGTQS